MATQLENNTSNLQEILNTVNALPSSTNTSHTQSADTITEGTFSGEVKAGSSFQNPTLSLLRNSSIFEKGLEGLEPSANGEIIWYYQ